MSDDDLPNETGSAGAGGRKSAAAYSVPALTKAMEVLDLLAGEANGLSVTDIVARLGRSMGELYRLIVALERLGLIARDAREERYFLTLKLFEMSHRHPPTERMVHAALPILDRLAEQTGQSAHLGAIDGSRLIVLAKADSRQAMHYSVRLGAAFELLETSSGVVIVAHSEKSVRERHLEQLPPEQRDDMRRRFDDAARLGFERRRSAVVSGVVNISCPILNHVGAAQAALTVPYLEHLHVEVSIEETLELTIAGARELSQSLGWSPDR